MNQRTLVGLCGDSGEIVAAVRLSDDEEVQALVADLEASGYASKAQLDADGDGDGFSKEQFRIRLLSRVR